VSICQDENLIRQVSWPLTSMLLNDLD
jgi:hypothetical protein